MNQKQREYSYQRIVAIETTKIAEVKKRFTVAAKKLEYDDKIKLIKTGKVKLRDNLDLYSKLGNAYDFSKHECEEKVDSKVDLIIAKIKKEAQAAKDRIMLAGDNEALSAITSFEKSMEKL